MQTILKLGSSELLHAAVGQENVSVLRVHIVHPADGGGGASNWVIRASGNVVPDGVRGWCPSVASVAARWRIARTEVMIPGQKHLRVDVLGIHTDKIADIETIGE